MLNNRQIEDNIRWLLEHNSTPVKYLTYRDLLGKEPNSKSMKKLFDMVKECDIVQEIFNTQEADGSWCANGPWALTPSYQKKSGHTPVSPKYVTTSWILPILGDMGFNDEDIHVKRACEYILSYQFANGFIAESHSNKYDVCASELPIEPCRFSLMLIALGKVGGGNDPRVKKSYDLLLQWQQDDGGWVSNSHSIQKNWTRSCPYATYHGAMALYSAHNIVYKDALTKAIDFLIKHLSTKNNGEIQRFNYHGHSIVHELLMFSELNMGLNNDSIQKILEWFMTMYHTDENCFRYAGKPISKHTLKSDYMDARVAKYRLFHLIEDDWLTFYLTKIMLNILRIQ